MEPFSDHLRHLNYLAKEYLPQEAVAEAIINLQAQLDELPQGTEDFISSLSE